MRRLEFLITQVRNSTDNKDTNGISNAEIVGYFNDAQNFISSLIFKHNPYADLFKTQIEYPANSTGIFEIPSNCYAVNAISMVEVQLSSTQYYRIKPISESEYGISSGYLIRDNQILIHGNTFPVRLTYFRQLPRLDIRRGTVTAAVGTSMTVTGLDSEASTVDENYSVVGADGSQLVSEVFSTSTSSPMTIEADKATEIAAAASPKYLVCGANAANVSPLPLACESYLLDYVRQRIYTRNNYEDANKQMYFTEQQRADVISIFSKNKKDDDNIPTTDNEFLTW